MTDLADERLASWCKRAKMAQRRGLEPFHQFDAPEGPELNVGDIEALITALREEQAEVERLKHDIERYIAAANSEAAEVSRLQERVRVLENDAALLQKEPLLGFGLAQIVAERRRQIDTEGWTPEHDAGHENGSLAIAAALYALEGLRSGVNVSWPWDAAWDKRKKHDPMRRLVIAGALIAAELDRLEPKEPST